MRRHAEVLRYSLVFGATEWFRTFANLWGLNGYDYKNVFRFWIGAAVPSILLAMIAWNAKPRE